MPDFDSARWRFYASEDVEISGKTKLYGIMGYPVAHSLSPLFQSLFLRQHEMDAVYVPFHVAPEDVEKALDGLWAIGVEGFNVTVPHKETVFRRVIADEDARCIGAVNTVRRSEQGWQATNTDWRGFADVLAGLGADMKGGEALMFGAGGTARAMLHTLARLGLRRLYVCNRNASRLDEFLEHAGRTYPGLECVPVAWEQDAVSDACSRPMLLVNATSIGLDDPAQAFPFALAGGGLAVDAVYTRDGVTPFGAAATQAGRKAVDGLPMLIAQGAASFAYWHTDTAPDRISALQWIGQRLGREDLSLPGWEGSA
ncbi:MAG: shikimate dehydrogenase [Mariprofundaceae bacterium]|nr:shikimate dehydrogenase [Mariprofundaceae bacterium]